MLPLPLRRQVRERTVMEMWGGACDLQASLLRPARRIPHRKALVTQEENLLLAVRTPQGDSRATMAFSSEEAVHTAHLSALSRWS